MPAERCTGDPTPSRISDLLEYVSHLIDRPGNDEIQLDLLYDCRTNVPLYPAFQEFFRKYQPPTLTVWGKNDHIFPAEGASPIQPRSQEHRDTHALYRTLRVRNTLC
jgi:hypothetical protein